MNKIYLTSISMLFVHCLFAQLSPEITSWIINSNNSTGYNNIPSNVQTVQYSASQVYVSATCIPGYSIGPWVGNPNTPANQNFVFKITRNPTQNKGTAINTALGHIGVWSNGVSIFNAKDGMSYNNAGVWNRNALYYEGASFDSCLGHPAPNGEYHHHVNPKCLYDDTDSLNHSPIIGYAFDGFPIYGAYGYSNMNGTGAIKRMKSSYVLSTASTRTNGPSVSATYPAGCYCEDYYYTVGAGDLDEHNGRFCITPEYPNGIYAYFVTLDNTLYPAYPFVIGKTYYGTVQQGNIGPNSGHVTISEATTVYAVTTREENISRKISYKIMPNPTKDYLFLLIEPTSANNIMGTIYNAQGQEIQTISNMQPSISYTFDLSNNMEGVYYLHLVSNKEKIVEKIIKLK